MHVGVVALDGSRRRKKNEGQTILADVALGDVGFVIEDSKELEILDCFLPPRF